MSRSKPDRLSSERRCIQRARHQRKEQREIERAYGDQYGPEEKWKVLQDDWEFDSQELQAFRHDAGRDLRRTAKGVGR